MDEAVIRIKDLRGESVYFHHEGHKHLAQVKQVWPGMGRVPGVNLVIIETNEEETSVPHVSAVSGATSFSGHWVLEIGRQHEYIKI